VSESDLPDYVKANRDHWTKTNAAYTDGRAEHAWNEERISWGTWNIPETEVNMLPDVRGKDVVELGCGTAYVSAWLKRDGARRVVGVDITPAQLDTARRLNTKYSRGLELVEANAEATGLPGNSFDIAISEYGASIWCDPYKWIPEAARLLRANGELVFLRNSTLSMLCAPETGKISERLVRPQLGLNRLDWADTGETEFQLAHGDLIRLLRKSGFEILDMAELFASADSVQHPFYGDFMSVEWARKWPSEEMWRARKRRRSARNDVRSWAG
jgi:ubiquinone/menaquinone biosynthesis C-methylase UbiE